MDREQEQRILRLAEAAAVAPEPEASLRALRALREELDELERRRVASALRSGASFGQVARAVGITRQSAHRRYRHLAW